MDTSIEVDEFYQELPDEVNVSHEHSEFLTGVLMELLTNGVKHGSATYFKVVLKGDAGHIRLSVEDNGSSDYNAENSQLKLQQGFGLKKIVSYVQRCGGEATFANEDGFKAVVELTMEILNSEG
jgi:signal transduction histidine kinase